MLRDKPHFLDQLAQDIGCFSSCALAGEGSVQIGDLGAVNKGCIRVYSWLWLRRLLQGCLQIVLAGRECDQFGSQRRASQASFDRFYDLVDSTKHPVKLLPSDGLLSIRMSRQSREFCVELADEDLH